MMMQKYKQNNKADQLCFFSCYPKHSELIQEEKCLRLDGRQQKADKISLKRATSHPLVHAVPQVHSVITLPTSHPPPPPRPLTIFHSSTRNSLQPLLSPKQSSRILLIPAAITPKPRITFEWKADLDRTKKAEPNNQPSVVVNTVDIEMEKTKPVHKLLKINPSKHILNSYKSSLISIQSCHSDESRHTPKVEQSMIMVDYFNPTNHQLQDLQSFLQKRQSQEQN